MSLLSLSNELLLEIASCFKYDSDINALMQTSGRLYYLLNTHLYRHNIRYFESSALEWAICNDVIPVAQKILDEGVPVNFLIGDSQAIKLAIRYGHESMVELFLERGVDPNPAELVYPTEEAGRKTKRLYEEGEAETPLHYALLNGSASTVRLLILHAKNFRGVQPTVGLWCEVPPGGEGLRIPASFADLMSACSKQDHTVVEFLALNIRSSVGAMGQGFISSMPLIEAVDLNHLEVTRVLLNAGYDPNYYSDDSGGEVPLHFAIKEDSIETVRLLLEKGARPDFAYKAYNENSLELLNQAARCGNAAIVKLLLQHIDVESKITSGHEE